MRIYEELFIAKPDAPDEEVDAFIEQMKTTVSNAGGTVDKVEKWGKRKLAYKVDRYREGAYVLVQFTAGPETVKEFERRLRVSDLVIKFLTVRIDETLKRLEKRKKDRDKRAHRKSIAAPASPQPSVAQQMMGEGAPAPAMPGLPKETPKEAPAPAPAPAPKEA
jgi:small subunit ribosomal protein S6